MCVKFYWVQCGKKMVWKLREDLNGIHLGAWAHLSIWILGYFMRSRQMFSKGKFY